MTDLRPIILPRDDDALDQQMGAEIGDILVDDGVRAYALGEESFRPIGKMAGLERIGEKLSRELRGLIEPFARAKTQVSPEAIRMHRFEAWQGALPAFTSLSQYRLAPMKGGVLVAIEPDFVTRMVDCFYGGTGKIAKAKAREFTPTEDRMMARLTDGLIQAVVAVWAEVAPLDAGLVGRETNAAFAAFVRADEPVVVQSFVVTPGHGKPTTLSLVYPLSGLRPFEALFAAKVHGTSGPADSDWRARLAAALENVRLPVRSVLARPEMSVTQLMNLKPGDVIPINLPPKAPLIVANRKLALGTIGEREGKASLMVEQVMGSR